MGAELPKVFFQSPLRLLRQGKEATAVVENFLSKVEHLFYFCRKTGKCRFLHIQQKFLSLSKSLGAGQLDLLHG